MSAKGKQLAIRLRKLSANAELPKRSVRSR